MKSLKEIQEQEEIVQQLDLIRAKQGMTRTQWSELAGISRTSLYRALGYSKSHQVSFDMVINLGKALGISLTKPL